MRVGTRVVKSKDVSAACWRGGRAGLIEWIDGHFKRGTCAVSAQQKHRNMLVGNMPSPPLGPPA